MHDIIDVIKNLQTLSENNSAFRVLKDFERVLDELDIYVFKNWEDGEIIAGPEVNRYDVTCKLMWERSNMPDPEGGKRLADYGCQVVFAKEETKLSGAGPTKSPVARPLANLETCQTPRRDCEPA